MGVSKNEAVVESSRLFGFKATSSQLRSIIEYEIEELCDSGGLEYRNGKLYAAEQ